MGPEQDREQVARTEAAPSSGARARAPDSPAAWALRMQRTAGNAATAAAITGLASSRLDRWTRPAGGMSVAPQAEELRRAISRSRNLRVLGDLHEELISIAAQQSGGLFEVGFVGRTFVLAGEQVKEMALAVERQVRLVPTGRPTGAAGARRAIRRMRDESLLVRLHHELLTPPADPAASTLVVEIGDDPYEVPLAEVADLRRLVETQLLGAHGSGTPLVAVEELAESGAASEVEDLRAAISGSRRIDAIRRLRELLSSQADGAVAVIFDGRRFVLGRGDLAAVMGALDRHWRELSGELLPAAEPGAQEWETAPYTPAAPPDELIGSFAQPVAGQAGSVQGQLAFEYKGVPDLALGPLRLRDARVRIEAQGSMSGGTFDGTPSGGGDGGLQTPSRSEHLRASEGGDRAQTQVEARSTVLRSEPRSTSNPDLTRSERAALKTELAQQVLGGSTASLQVVEDFSVVVADGERKELNLEGGVGIRGTLLGFRVEVGLRLEPNADLWKVASLRVAGRTPRAPVQVQMADGRVFEGTIAGRVEGNLEMNPAAVTSLLRRHAMPRATSISRRALQFAADTWRAAPVVEGVETVTAAARRELAERAARQGAAAVGEGVAGTGGGAGSSAALGEARAAGAAARAGVRFGLLRSIALAIPEVIIVELVLEGLDAFIEAERDRWRRQEAAIRAARQLGSDLTDRLVTFCLSFQAQLREPHRQVGAMSTPASMGAGAARTQIENLGGQGWSLEEISASANEVPVASGVFDAIAPRVRVQVGVEAVRLAEAYGHPRWMEEVARRILREAVEAARPRVA